MCSNDPIDYSLIAVDDEAGDAELENDTASKKSSGCRSMYSKALHEVPPVEDVHMEVPITRSDILTLLENLKQSMAKGSTRPAISSLTNDEAFAFHNDLSTVISPSQRSTRETPRSMLPTSPLTAGFSTSEGEPTIATREEIEQLLTTYRMEITRLSLAKYRKMASREEAQRKQKLEERGTTEFADDDEEDTDLSSLRKSSNQQKTPRSERPEKQTKSNLQPPIEKKTSPSPRKTPRQQAAAMMNQFTLESNMYQQQQFQQQQQQQFSLSRQQEESYHKNQSAEFIGKVFDDDDLKMLPDLLRDDKTISLPPIPSARDAQGNKKPTIQFNPPVPILQTSRRVKQRPTSNGGGSAKSSARDAEFNPYRMPYDDNDNDEQQYDPSDHYDYDYNYGTKYADDDQEDGKEHNNDEDEDDYAQQRKKKSSEALRQSLVDQVRRVVEC